MSSNIKKVALVTGGSSGIGLAVVERFIELGMTAVSASRSGSAGIQMDVADEESVVKGLKRILSDYGRFDVLVNCAGIVSQSQIIDCTTVEWDTILDVNLKGAFLCSKHAIRYFLQSGEGAIVNVASIAGRNCSPTASEAYTCSKYGIIGLTKQLAVRYAGKKIRVNCVCPSQTLTPMLLDSLSEEKIAFLAAQNPTGRLAKPNEVAEAIVFLAGSKASYINGAILDVNGGKCF
jgi:NAD(P)-dependent dehydrogenase (short-subunit alcohol dehydrogenase family)